MLKIGIFSKLSRLSIQMLCYYDGPDLFKPLQTDAATGYRYYSKEPPPRKTAQRGLIS